MRIGIAQRHHAGGEDVAVLVGHALAVAEQEAVPLQAFVEIVGVVDIALRDAGVEDIDILVQFEPADGQRLLDLALAADENGPAKSRGGIAVGGADHAVFLALGKDHPLGRNAHLLEDGLHGAGDRVEPRRKLRHIGIEIGDMAPCDAAVHRGLCHGDRHGRDEARIEGHGDEIVPPEAEPRAVIGGGHLVRHVLARQVGQGLGRSDLHLFIDGAGPHVERAAEDVGKAQDVVDLVGIVGAPRRHDGIRSDLGHFLRGDLGIGIGHGEDDGIGRHAL